MPVDRIVVHRVDAAQTGNPDVMSYTITANTCEAQPRIVQYQTINQWESAYCKESIKPRTVLLMDWKASRYGKDVVKVGPSES